MPTSGRFPQVRDTFWGVPITRTIIFGGLCWGPPISGNYHFGPFGLAVILSTYFGPCSQKSS